MPLGRVVLALVMLAAAPAYAADGIVDPDSEVARRHFDQGGALYDAGRYAEAAREFQAARDIKPLPAFDFNIGRCMERLERWAEAVAAFERYLPAADARELPELRARLAVLRARAGKTQVTAGAAPAGEGVTPAGVAEVATPRGHGWRLRAPALALGLFALAAGGVAAGLVGSVSADFHALESECMHRPCSDGDGASLAHRLQAGYALGALAGVAAIADAVVIGLLVRERRAPVMAVAPLPGGAVVNLAGRF